LTIPFEQIYEICLEPLPIFVAKKPKTQVIKPSIGMIFKKGLVMGAEWNLSKYQIEAAAQALEAVWGGIQKHEKLHPGTLRLQDVNHVLKVTEGGYNGACHILLMLKSEKTAKGQIAKMADLCRRVSSFENFANEHKIALSGVTRFLEQLSAHVRLPKGVQMQTKGAAQVAKRLFSESQHTPLPLSQKLSSAKFHHKILVLKQKIALLPISERTFVEHLLIRGEKQLKEAKTEENASSCYQETLHKIVAKIGSFKTLSDRGKDFKRWLDTQDSSSSPAG
jgi:hypothetical protein